MKILIHNYEYPPLGGGAGNATEYMLREFSAFPDMEIVLVTSSVDDVHRTEYPAPNVRIERLPVGKKDGARDLHFQSKANLLEYSWKSWIFSRKLLKRETFDCMHAFFSVPSGFVMRLLSMEFHIPYIVSLRGSDVPGYSERFKNLYLFLRPVTRFIWRNAAQVIANSEGLRTLALLTESSRDILVVRNGVDIKEFFSVPRNYSSDISEPFQVLAIARLTPRKGLRSLLEAMRMLKTSEERKFLLDIAGDGHERESLEAFVVEHNLSDRVRFVGRVPHSEIVPLYHRAHVYVLPSLNEGMSNNVLEALACGLPIITTDTGGTRELVEDGVNGCIIRMRDSQHIAEKIAFLASHPEEAKRYGEESRRRAESLGWSEVAKSYRRAYEDAITSKS
ncbi:MAG: glycosyltransferase family 4 protein [Candidatus Moraniibacteriota bacterium]|nr:MAG: glycosyltransferase family 4 protein [Candidatus Moranbacteria bacterium]